MHKLQTSLPNIGISFALRDRQTDRQMKLEYRRAPKNRCRIKYLEFYRKGAEHREASVRYQNMLSKDRRTVEIMI